MTPVSGETPGSTHKDPDLLAGFGKRWCSNKAATRTDAPTAAVVMLRAGGGASEPDGVCSAALPAGDATSLDDGATWTSTAAVLTKLCRSSAALAWRAASRTDCMQLLHESQSQRVQRYRVGVGALA